MNSTTSTLADVDRSAAPTPFLDPEKDRNELSGESTRAPSTIEMEKKQDPNETDTETATVDGVPPGDNQQELEGESKYPTGIRLAVIVLALILSVFLVSLDMVSEATFS